MNVIEIEKLKSDLNFNLKESTSKKQKLILINDFLDVLLKSSDPLIIESYSIDLLEEYSKLLFQYDPECSNPELTESILNTAKQLNDFDFIKDKRNDIIQNINLISVRLEKLNNILNGVEEENKSSKTGMFPLLEESINGNEIYCVT